MTDEKQIDEKSPQKKAIDYCPFSAIVQDNNREKSATHFVIMLLKEPLKV